MAGHAGLRDVVDFLDRELALSAFPNDDSANGLQFEGSPTVRKIGVAVDACEPVFAQAREQGIDFLFVHHGLIWGGIRSVSGITKTRIRTLLESQMSLYACHLPLDQHPVHGNNAGLLRLLAIRKKGDFGSYHGRKISYWGSLSREIPLEVFTAKVDRALSTRSVSVGLGRGVRNVGVLSGSGWFAIIEAEQCGIDTLLTGETSHTAYLLAKEMQVNLVFAGHYATEVPGVKAVGEALRSRFGTEVVFIDHPTGF